MDQPPQIRANWPKFVVRCTKHFRDPSGLPVADSIPTELRREIREAGRLTWQDARVLMDLAEVIRQVCGSTEARAFWRMSFRESINQPMLAPLARGALILFGNVPGALVRRTPQAWQLFTRNCGSLRAVDVGEENAVLLRVENFPRICRVAGFVSMVEGGLESEMDYFRVRGTVETRAESFLARGFAEFVARWGRDR
jgi:hypothetical protein